MRQRGCEPVSRSLLPLVLPRAARARSARRTTTDGGLTWSTPVASSPVPPQELDFNGAQPLVLPNGTLVVVYTAFADPAFRRPQRDPGDPVDGRRRHVLGTRPCRTRSRRQRSRQSERSPLASAEVDAAGRMYVAWEGCPGAGSCYGEPHRHGHLRRRTSPWTPAQSMTAGESGVDHFLPGIGASPTAAGQARARLPLDPRRLRERPGVYRASTSSSTTSENGGRTWSKQQRLTAESMQLDSIARTRLGLHARRLRLDVVRP